MKKEAHLARLALLSTFVSFSAASEQRYDDFGFIGASGAYGQTVFSDKGGGQAALEPNLFYNGQHGFIDGSLANLSLLPYFGLTGQWRFAEVSNDFDQLPNGINDRDGNGEVGVTLGTVGARVTFLHDVTNQHNGYEVQLHLGRTFELPVPDFTLTPYVEIDYRDKKLSQHLYGVSTLESSQSGLNVFEASDSWVYQSGLIGLYHLTPDWLGLAKLELVHHDSSSPLVQRDLGWSVSLGVVYQFTD
ncbi:MipA/OmpV family protein [Vibrio brasiliensis]|nr:MipA/OmpV family protein [Vibrio brasiliensis]MCG9783005.1 MipA/OmpV family protein [Vibrio brasiliensis]